MFTSHVRADGTAVFYYPDERPSQVFAIGDFNGWRQPGVPLHRIRGGWYGEYEGIGRGEYGYKLIVDGHWTADPSNVLRKSDGHGSENSILSHGGDRGSVYHFEFFSPSINETRGYCIYLPPSYFYTENRFSTIYLLHGALDWEYTWVHRGYVNQTLDQLRRAGSIGDMIVVMPKENGEYFKGDDHFASYIFNDLRGHIDFEFKTIPHQQHRALDGLSTGGYSSLVIGANHPEIFSSIGAMSGSYDGRTVNTLKYNADRMRAFNQRYYISCGLGDPSYELSGQMAQIVKGLGLECEFHANPGPHDWEFWGPSVAGNLQFHWWSFQR